MEIDERNWQKIPSIGSELGDRLKWVVGFFESQAAAADVAGLSLATLKNQMSGSSRAALLPMAALCGEAGVDLNWLATGNGEPRRGGGSAAGLDLTLIERIIRWQREDLDRRGLEVEPHAFARLCMSVYRLADQQRQALREANVDKNFTTDDFAIFQEIIRDSIS